MGEDILDQIDALTEPRTVVNLDPVIPDGTNGWDAAEYGKRDASTSGVESMMSVRHVAWHEIGNVIPEALRSSDIETILSAAGMDWTVSKRALRAADSLNLEVADFTIPTDDFFAIVRDDTSKVLGVVKKAYEPFQNRDALEFLNDLLQSTEVTIETAGVLFEGAKFWVLANIPMDMTIEGDIHVPYLLISGSHDGSGSVRSDLTMMRVECQNSLRWGIRNRELLAALQAQGIENPTPSWTHRHSRNVKAKAGEARKMLGFAASFVEAYGKDIEDLMAKVVSPKAFDRMLQEFDFTTGTFSAKRAEALKDLTDRQKANQAEKRDKVRAFYESPSDGGKFQGTGWGVAQAFSSFDLWGADIREGEKNRPNRQMVRLIDGTTEKRSNSVRDRIEAIR